MVRYNYPPPDIWQNFENLVCDLWQRELDDLTMQKVGREGQTQNGVDIYSPKKEIGIQCKHKTIGKQIKESELREEIDKAKKFKPKLKEYYIITTAKKDVNIETLAWEITQEHKKDNLFSVTVFGWETVKQKIDAFPDVRAKHYPGYGIESLSCQSDSALEMLFINPGLKEPKIYANNHFGQQIYCVLKNHSSNIIKFPPAFIGLECSVGNYNFLGPDKNWLNPNYWADVLLSEGYTKRYNGGTNVIIHANEELPICLCQFHNVPVDAKITFKYKTLAENVKAKTGECAIKIVSRV